MSWRQLPEAERFVGLTIGTGLGGSFIENGEIVTAGDTVPPHGEVWDLPYPAVSWRTACRRAASWPRTSGSARAGGTAPTAAA